MSEYEQIKGKIEVSEGAATLVGPLEVTYPPKKLRFRSSISQSVFSKGSVPPGYEIELEYQTKDELLQLSMLIETLVTKMEMDVPSNDSMNERLEKDDDQQRDIIGELAAFQLKVAEDLHNRQEELFERGLQLDDERRLREAAGMENTAAGSD